ncbi:sodium:proton antiporter [Marinobacterium iners]|jgi:Na+/H+ antiporter NhaD/arsenite permease-like protein|uniref:Na+/H+ antiporter NhaD n=1 Tax=Marinobacterium iners DSM 11526 TaxID=1122198 RepID=A0A1H4GW77_9GAMM|nr:sodium:proton antiporter NhaD [Marinobacterium iners]QSR36155.1 sodium:proton antiporter [Marinobacterium iners]SEB13138.1 Na+/H+ antiporter NhaD [Marinobacterium iners DSM 11526]
MIGKHLLPTAFMALLSSQAQAGVQETPQLLDLTASVYGYLALLIFLLAYVFVVMEERLALRKSKPVIVAAGLIWVLVGLAYRQQGDQVTAGAELRLYILDYAELFLFLLAAMTFVNMLEERRVFEALRTWLVSRGFSLRSIYWITGVLTFCISPIADNLSTALLMGAVVLAVGNHNYRFISVGCINVVVAANAGGAFSPFGDITTLMVWQQGHVSFTQFSYLLLPALVNWLIPAALMSLAIKNGRPAGSQRHQRMKKGGVTIMLMFLGTIIASVLVHSMLHLPPVLGMMTGLGVLKLYGYYLSLHDPVFREQGHITHHHAENTSNHSMLRGDHTGVVRRFDIFKVVERASWDTLMFFYGIVLCVGGLATLGYLADFSTLLYGSLGIPLANSLIGLLSALVDNIPIMFAVLSMDPGMTLDQWLLATLTVGTGGSLLSIGSAAGVALMGQAQGTYTFMSHLKWSWAILLGYVASIFCHLWLTGL